MSESLPPHYGDWSPFCRDEHPSRPHVTCQRPRHHTGTHTDGVFYWVNHSPLPPEDRASRNFWLAVAGGMTVLFALLALLTLLEATNP